MESPVPPYLYVAVIGVTLFNLVKGFRTGAMRFPLVPTVTYFAERRDDPTGFWINAATNLLLGLMFAWLLLALH